MSRVTIPSQAVHKSENNEYDDNDHDCDHHPVIIVVIVKKLQTRFFDLNQAGRQASTRAQPL